MMRAASTYASVAAACLAVAAIGALSATGRWPGNNQLERFEPKGILATPAKWVARIEISVADGSIVFSRRGQEDWSAGGAETGDQVSAHIKTALRMLSVSAPLRVIEAGGYHDADVAEFGLDPPHTLVALVGADGSSTTIGFGELNPAQTSQYVRVIGRSSVYLMSRHVGAEWELALDMAKRTSPDSVASGGAAAGSGAFLVPVSMAQVWAVEIVDGGMLQRFERDGAGDWFHHVGEHVHAGAADAHRADPRLAPVIAAELAAFERTPVEAVVARGADDATLAGYGLAHPPTILLLYARDSSRPVARIALGVLAADGFHRYARARESGAVVTIPAYEAMHLTKLLRLAGAP